MEQKEIEPQTEDYHRIISGYIQIYYKKHWVMEHRFLVSEYLGRELKDFEVIHHKNQNKKDNRIFNLVLFPNESLHAKFHLQLLQYGETRPLSDKIYLLQMRMVKIHKENQLKKENEEWEEKNLI